MPAQQKVARAVDSTPTFIATPPMHGGHGAPTKLQIHFGPVECTPLALGDPEVRRFGEPIRHFSTAFNGLMAVTGATHSPDLAQWKWDGLPGSTVTLPSG
jgi:hypothetical protein